MDETQDVKECRPRSRTIHGCSSVPTRAYNSWSQMKTRCNNPRDKNYTDYGGRGITVCERWNDFRVFLADIGEPPAGTTLDRIDNASGYSRDNCRWATHIEQHNNKRGNLHLTYDGITKTCAQWARHVGVSYGCFISRVRRGWSMKKIVETPVRKWVKHV